MHLKSLKHNCLQPLTIKLSVLFIVFTISSGLSFINAQELEPRAYTNLPVGMNFVVAGYSYQTGGVLFDPAIPLENANIKTHSSLFAYARSIKVGHISGKGRFYGNTRYA